MARVTRNIQDELNRLAPAAAHAKLGDVLVDLITGYNDLATQYNSLLAKLDADAGVTDTDYAATLAASDAALVELEARDDLAG